MNLTKWLAKTSPQGKKLTPGERVLRRRERAEACEKAGTNMNSLRQANHRKIMGIDLATRLEAATAGTRNEFKIVDQMPELAKAPG